MSGPIPYFTSKPRRLGCLLRKYLSGSLWSGWLPSVLSQWLQQHCRVTGTFGSHCIYAPTSSSSFHIIFHLDSQYVLGDSLPSSNLEFAILLLDYYHYLSSQTCVELRKVKSHTGIPGNDRADLNGNKGLSSHTSIGSFATCPPLELPSLPFLNSPSAHLIRLTLFKLSPPPPMNAFLVNPLSLVSLIFLQTLSH